MGEQDDRGTGQRHPGVQHIPGVGTLAFPDPQPEHAGRNVDAAVSREDPPGQRDVDAGQNECKRRE